ncbi:neuromedin-S [Apteryx rowi]|uniref:neuromedin-S n=1 Tax=Apteryx rowi TaxID=308060 RepID=UPI000E1DF431|nr:neuromedin-S [Apteryx rowi]
MAVELMKARFPQPLSRHLDGADLPKSQQLALCFSQWMELSNQPQISSTVLDLCYSIFNSMHTNEESQIAAAEFTKKDRHGTLGQPFFLFRPRNGRTIEGSECLNCTWSTKAYQVLNGDKYVVSSLFLETYSCGKKERNNVIPMPMEDSAQKQ